MNLVFTAQWFRFGGQRCSLLNAALCVYGGKSDIRYLRRNFDTSF
ncbi:hypothetical protein DA098_12560 [Vibrio parahaemolyticus]|nr:hypothetical protein DA098_12560 [Vibrio parahaemolyticus]TMX77616.1 hypothetical protein DA094_12270 [Vibrio parahaemolyticus]